MSHGFDDQGSQFDKYGNQHDWWTAADKKKFEARTKVLVDYFSKVEALPGKFINGKLTLGENIGDNDGLNNTDPHSPAEARVNGALPQIDAWYKAFNVKKSDKLFLDKKKRAQIW